ncbi:MAG: glycosyltransferase family 2 protein [Burkholderiales bacterium]
MFRLDALQAAGGYLDTLIAGEEPELCVRLRAMGWQVWRADAEMTLHDAAMTRFGQWWQRSRRAGYAFAEGARLHGAPPERHWVREKRRAVLWGLALPVALTGASLVLLAMTASGSWALTPWLLLPAQWLRLFARERGGARSKAVKVTFLLLGKVPESWGVVQSFFSGNKPRQLIEYK